MPRVKLVCQPGSRCQRSVQLTEAKLNPIVWLMSLYCLPAPSYWVKRFSVKPVVRVRSWSG
ncbi:MAG: hypothetical protein KGO52_10175 [Nitrospirota bacterium]|nr:hypothetical protein [Nitrospirota bacterium]MDE3243072.1 hypothetical protein [Nitrospirota bacterium]